MHWGSELATVPFPWQQALGRDFINAGADAVVGHHPHVVQSIELYKGRYIAYSVLYEREVTGNNPLFKRTNTIIIVNINYVTRVIIVEPQSIYVPTTDVMRGVPVL